LAQLLYVETAGLPSALINQIKRLAAFQNPEFYKKQALRLPTALTPRVVSCAEDHPQHVGLPRGCREGLEDLLRHYEVDLEITDARCDGQALAVSFRGVLAEAQEKAVQALIRSDEGIFVAPPGSGKTVVAASLIARRACNTLVLVHRAPLLEQWLAQLAIFLDLDPKQIGRIGGGRRNPTGIVDVAMIQSLVRRGAVDEIVGTYGHVIVDECHHLPAVSFERVMREIGAKYVTGLTATPRRRDGHHPILGFLLGPIRHIITAQAQAAEQAFLYRLVVRETSFALAAGTETEGIQGIYGQLACHGPRNDLIVDDVISALGEGRSPILLTERRDHLEYLAERLRGAARNLVVLRGGMGRKQRGEAAAQLAQIPDGEERLILATGRFIGEGFDDARLDTLFLAMPVAWRGTLVQYAGRLHRSHGSKREVRIVDYVDRRVPMLGRMFEKRMRGYRAMGYLEGGALGLM
jgi:superfamily II DNA or RNA helicase